MIKDVKPNKQQQSISQKIIMPEIIDEDLSNEIDSQYDEFERNKSDINIEEHK